MKAAKQVVFRERIVFGMVLFGISVTTSSIDIIDRIKSNRTDGSRAAVGGL